MCPETSLSKSDTSLKFKFDFTFLLDSVVNIECKRDYFQIDAFVDGVHDIRLDAGIPLFKKDGTLLFDSSSALISELIDPQLISNITTFWHLQTAFLKICIESTRGAQMLKSNACLLWLILDYATKFSLGTHEVNECLGHKRRVILKNFFDFVPRGAEKFLSKIVLLRGKSNELELIKRVIINTDILNELSHWNSVPIQALYLIERYPELSGARYLEEWCSRRLRRISDYLIGVPEIYKTTLDTIELGVAINIKNSRNIVKACNTINQLNVLHDKWTEVSIRTNNYYEPDIEFVEPGINETEEIKWVSSANALIDEGVQMEHCVATYIKKVIDGRSIIFSILFPERATAEIRKRNGSFELVELKLKRNQEASAQTFERVNSWLESYNKA